MCRGRAIVLQCSSAISLGQTFLKRASAGEAGLWSLRWDVGVRPYLQWADGQVCPGFGWDRVNFLSSSWYRVMFWVQYENNVDNALMFSVVK